ncbi:MAG: hypothetical protein CMP91_10510 [Gammaproteobacteria bacterium]|nr:hypothetical protein [Gammaproteobacteria bacterium]MAY01355.1 hypothetical protein [Gammaproteobacteria bacterium]|tara:strand:+ start:112707 stop:114263 length:1557 start_codon:yes stop_codon:yes gene_type:complete
MKMKKNIRAQLAGLVILGLTAQAGQAALVDMAEYQDWDAVEASISTEDVNAVQPDGMTALFWATYYDETDVVRLLLNAGANPNIENRYGMTPLIQAAMNGNSDMISMLLDAGADANATTPEGDNALLNASKTGAAEGVQALIDAGANVNSLDGYLFQTPLMWAASANQADVVRILIDNGANINMRSPALELRGVRQGAVSGDFPNGGLTALHHAARENAIDATRVLIAEGADLNVLDPHDISPLRFAIINANIDLAKVLVEAGANMNDGALVDLIDVETKELTFVRSEKNYENQTSPMELIELMLSMGVEIDAYPEQAYPFPATGFRGGAGTANRTALFNLAMEDNQDLIAMFLEHGANPNSLNMDGKYFPLSAALGVVPVRGGNMMMEDGEEAETEISESVQLLLDNGADVNAIAGDGTSVLHQAVSTGNETVVEFLIAEGADLSIKDNSNRTALDVANGVSPVSDGSEPRRGPPGSEPAELPVYEEIATLLTEAMNAQGITIEEYVAPVTEESGEA